MRFALWSVLFGFVLLVGLVGGVLLDRGWLARFVPLAAIPPSAEPDFRLMAEAWNTIDEHYVDRPAIKPRMMTYGAISGMVVSLGDDEHSTFLSPELVKMAHQFEQGELQGVGIEVHSKAGHVVVVAPLDNSPALRAGVRPGDIILAVDGHSIEGMPLTKVVGLISGPPKTRVSLRLRDPDSDETRTLTMERASVTVPNVAWHRLPGTRLAHLRLAQFSSGAGKHLKEALSQITQAHLDGLVLDLRNDPGGLLDQAVEVASQFLAGGNVLIEKDASGDEKPIPVIAGGVAPKIPLVVLINRGTASAAEIVAGALEDAGRARLVGERTFGTGTVLSEFPLSDGSALLLAVREWLTPKGHTIWHQGIEPDVPVSLPEGVTPLWPEAEQQLTAAELSRSKDAQLLRAVAMLSSHAGKKEPSGESARAQ